MPHPAVTNAATMAETTDADSWCDRCVGQRPDTTTNGAAGGLNSA